MSIVPALALAFAITKGFGYYQHFRVQLLTQFPEHQVVFTELFTYADILLNQTRGGIVASFGIVVLVVAVVLLLSSLEGMLNHIWGVRNLRTWWRLCTDYIAIMIFAPLFFLLANTLTVLLVEGSTIVIELLPFPSMAIRWLLFLIHLLPYCFFWMLFTLIYLVIPNIKVRFRSALIAGVLAGSATLILQWGYIYFQVGASRYGAIYGSMAAIPLFLVWLQLSWALVLFGAEISYAHQMAEEHEYEKPIRRISLRMKRVISLLLAYLAVREGFLTIEELAKRHKIPKGLSRKVLTELVDAQMLTQNKQGYAPSAQLFEMRLADCLEALDLEGVDRFPFMKPGSILEQTLAEFQKTIQSHPQNIRIQDVPNPL